MSNGADSSSTAPQSAPLTLILEKMVQKYDASLEIAASIFL
jgi:hypothetical protein